MKPPGVAQKRGPALNGVAGHCPLFSSSSAGSICGRATVDCEAIWYLSHHRNLLECALPAAGDHLLAVTAAYCRLCWVTLLAKTAAGGAGAVLGAADTQSQKDIWRVMRRRSLSLCGQPAQRCDGAMRIRRALRSRASAGSDSTNLHTAGAHLSQTHFRYLIARRTSHRRLQMHSTSGARQSAHHQHY